MGLVSPGGFALLPRNFEFAKDKTELLHEDTAPTMRAVFQEVGLTVTLVEPENGRLPYVEENSMEWVGPILLIGTAIYSGNPHAINVALGLISNYVTDYFKGRLGKKRAKFDLVIPIPNTDKYAKIKYDGEIDGILGLEKLIKEIRRRKK